MGRLVQKFGGTSVDDAKKLRHAAEIVVKEAAAGNQVVVVVSAMGRTTDQLISLADSIADEQSARELDMLLATGEQVSIALLTMAIQQLGGRARSFTGAQAGIITDEVHGSARIKEVRAESLAHCLQRSEIAVVAGFQGITESGEITTLGRGGSDTTAVALAAALKAEWCDIYTDVNGVYTADPHAVAKARRLEAISYEEMLELSAAGAKVLNARAVELAMNTQVPIRLRSTFEPEDEGTLVTHKFLAPEYTVCGIACDTSHTSFNVKVTRALPDTGNGHNGHENGDGDGHSNGNAHKGHHNGGGHHNRIGNVIADGKGIGNGNGSDGTSAPYLEAMGFLFRRLHDLGITTDNVTLIGKENGAAPELVFTCEKRNTRRVQAIIESMNDELGKPEVSVDSTLARISVIGSGLSCRRGLVAAIFDTLCNASIPIRMLTTGDIRVTALVPEQFRKEAVNQIHEKFCIYPPVDARAFSS
jgi:aspartate kinase